MGSIEKRACSQFLNSAFMIKHAPPRKPGTAFSLNDPSIEAIDQFIDIEIHQDDRLNEFCFNSVY